MIPMKPKIKAITDFAFTISITEAMHIIGLVGYNRKFFPIFRDTIGSLNELTKKNDPFKWTDQCQRSLEYIKHIITINPILIYPDPNKQYQAEQTNDDRTKIKI